MDQHVWRTVPVGQNPDWKTQPGVLPGGPAGGAVDDLDAPNPPNSDKVVTFWRLGGYWYESEGTGYRGNR